MLSVTGLDFTPAVTLFSHLQNRGDEVLITCGRKLLKTIRFPFVLIITCDRAEVVSENKVPPETLERALGVNPIAVSRCRYSIEGPDAEKHVFLLSSGIISPLFGEDTVQGQIAAASAVARLIGSSSPLLDKLLNMAVAFSKKMHTAYKLRVFDKSIAEAVAKRLAGYPRVLIVGSGESARTVASLLLPEHEVHITLRDETKTFLIPPGAVAVSYENRMEEALHSDAVISASSGLYLTFTPEEASRLAGKPLFDLSSPPDLPDIEGVIRVSDLGVREGAKEQAVEIVNREAESAAGEFRAWKERTASIPDTSYAAERVAMEAMRRLEGPVSRLSLGPESEKALRTAIIDSVRKAYISTAFRRD